MPDKIFINCRRSLNLDDARLLRAELQKYFGKSRVFLDVRNIDGGDKWLHKLENEIDQSSAMVALIGNGWIDAADDEGYRRLDHPDDFVRFEIARALNHGIPVLPVLINRAPMPTANQLPQYIKALAFTQGMPLRTETLEDDAEKIADSLRHMIAANRPIGVTVSPAVMIAAATSICSGAAIYGLSYLGLLPHDNLTRAQKVLIQSLEQKVSNQAKQIARLHEKTLELENLTVRFAALRKREEKLENKIQTQLAELNEKDRKITKLDTQLEEFLAGYEVGKTFKDCDDCPEMVVLPAGSFIMGSEAGESAEKPSHEVKIANRFAVSRFEITFAEWNACVVSGICQHKPDDVKWGRETRPVINVSWEDAKAYVQWLNTKVDGSLYRLLSEAEWEYAARAGATGSAYTWGDTIGTDKANCKGCGSRWDDKKTAPVGSFAANAFGLHDMHGNVWEWTEDCWNEDYKRAPDDGAAWTALGNCKLRVVRGGAWSVSSDNLSFVRRYRYDTKNRLSSVGFRVARTIQVSNN